jgi:hypothetical protein
VTGPSVCSAAGGLIEEDPTATHVTSDSPYTEAFEAEQAREAFPWFNVAHW